MQLIDGVLGGVLVDGTVYKVFVDESGSDEPVERVGAKGKARIFVVFAAILKPSNISKLEEVYRDLLDREFVIVDRFRIRELFNIFKRATGREPEIKASYLNNREGPFAFFKYLPKRYDDRYEEFRKCVFETMLRALVDASTRMIAVVLDKVSLHRLSKKTGVVYDPRLTAMDYLFTRIANALENFGGEAIVIHDDTYRSTEVKDLLNVLKQRGYFYNPRLKKKPRYSLITGIEFVDSARCIPIQFVDLAANVVLNTRAGASKEFYNIIASSSKYIEVHVPRDREKV